MVSAMYSSSPCLKKGRPVGLPLVSDTGWAESVCLLKSTRMSLAVSSIPSYSMTPLLYSWALRLLMSMAIESAAL